MPDDDALHNALGRAEAAERALAAARATNEQLLADAERAQKDARRFAEDADVASGQADRRERFRRASDRSLHAARADATMRERRRVAVLVELAEQRARQDAARSAVLGALAGLAVGWLLRGAR